jgi:predicted CXXCH cytochrome family protein
LLKANSLVPFEWDETTNEGLAGKFGIGSGPGPDATDNVMCLSCHRVHASAFTSMTRYEIAELVTGADGTYVARAGFTPAAVARSYNDRASTDFKAGQRQLCNK